MKYILEPIEPSLMIISPEAKKYISYMPLSAANEMGYPVYYGDPKKIQEWWFLMIFKVIQTMGRAFHLSMAKSIIFTSREAAGHGLV